MPRGILRVRNESIKSLNQDQGKKRLQMFLNGPKAIDRIKERVVKISPNG